MRNLKRVLSLALALVMVLGMMVITTSAATYTDADEITYEEAVAVMTGVGLYEGNPDGTLAPKQVLTREMAATIVTRIMLGDLADDLAPTKQIFTDVATDRWSAAAIEYCYNTGAIVGNGDGTFNPEGQLTGTAFAKLLLCAMGYDAGSAGYEGDAWEQNINADALAQDLVIEGVKITDKLTREQAAQMVLQALPAKMVRYVDSYDYATGAHIVLGPLDLEKTFQENYYPTLTKKFDEYAMWGRPYEYVWYYQTKEIYSVMKTPVKTYTEAVYECDIAEDLGLKANAVISKATLNNESTTVNNSEINLLATRVAIGDQGRLTEIYKNGKTYEIVMIDTYLAQVTDVTDCTYDRNGHLDEEAELTLDVYLDEDATEEILYDDEDWNYKVNEWLLVYFDEKNDTPVIMGAPEVLEGAQTAYTTVETHEVEDKEYNDAHTFYLDEAGNETTDHNWFFDFYGNLIGVIDLPKAPDTYGVLASIYWRDSRDGEAGYAYGKIVYMDGSSEWKKIAEIDDEELVGIEGDKADYETREVSSTKQYNVDDFTNKALYKLVPSSNGLKLVPVEDIEGQLTTNKKTVIVDEAYVNSKTMFLVWDTVEEEYFAYVGVKNLPDYLNDSIEMWAAELDDEDTTAEYVFVIDPATKGAKDETEVVLYNANAVTIKTNLKDGAIVSYTVRGGKINNVAANLTIAAGEDETAYTDNYLVDRILDSIADHDGMMVLTIVNGKVTEVKRLTTTTTRELDDDMFVTNASVLGTYCFYEADDESLEIDGEWYDVADATLIGATSWAAAERAQMNVYIVYDLDNIATFVYFVENPFA